MKNPFKSKPPIEKPNRNSFDLSHNVNFTAQFGKLYPVLCQEVIPGDSFQIDTSLGLRLMPLLFPVQSRMRADIHFFFVRNRNLWADWKDFIYAQKSGLTPPWIRRTTSQSAFDVFGTKSLGDYLGIPTTVSTSTRATYSSPMLPVMSSSQIPSATGIYGTKEMQDTPIPLNVSNDALGWQQATSFPTITSVNQNLSLHNFNSLLLGTGTKTNVVQGRPLCRISESVTGSSRFELIHTEPVSPVYPSRVYLFLLDSDNNTKLGAWSTNSLGFTATAGVTRSSQFSSINVKRMFAPNDTISLAAYINIALEQGFNIVPVFEMTAPADLGTLDPRQTKFKRFFNGLLVTDMTQSIIGDAIDTTNNPFVGTNPDIRISALPYRAYESIYNSFYRNMQNDPFMINGVPEYNKYIHSQDGGSDDYAYGLRYRNWELDFLTSAMPSPQQGIAPLVGARQSSDKTYILQYKNVGGTAGELHLTGGETNDLTAVSNYGDDALNEPTIKALQQAVDFGISINDFRNVNSLQRWLEKNVRHGYRYKDQMLAHFGIEISLKELDMPEFLGGVSQDISVNPVTQTVQMSDSSPLGAFAGQGSCFGRSDNKVNNYFDEHGFIMAIFSVSPIPSYSQLLPKHLQKSSHLDYYTPEFAHIGLQPITYREICPNEAKDQGLPLDNVFGYQRPFYDYLANVDRVHGEMRTSLRSFLVNRYFSTPPQLGGQFLQLNSDECNNIFTVQDDAEDKIIGQVYFDIKAKRPIPMFAEGRLE